MSIKKSLKILQEHINELMIANDHCDAGESEQAIVGALKTIQDALFSLAQSQKAVESSLKVIEIFNEPIFVLRAKDMFAPRIVRIWAQTARRHDCPNEKVNEAFDISREMEQWQKENGCKIPD